MKDKSLFLFPLFVVSFLIFGSVLVFREAPDSLSERVQSALEIQNLEKFTATLDGDKVYLLGEALTVNEIKAAAEVVAAVEGVSSVDTTHAKVTPELKPPHLSLAIAGNRITVQGQLPNAEIEKAILEEISQKYPDAQIDHSCLIVSDEVDAIPGFANIVSARSLDLSSAMFADGVVAAVGNDLVWEIVKAGTDPSEVRSTLKNTIPVESVPAVIEEFKDLVSLAHADSELVAVRGMLKEKNDEALSYARQLKNREADLEKVGMQLAETIALLADSNRELREAEQQLANTKGMLATSLEKISEVEKREAEAQTQVEAMTQQLIAARKEIDSKTKLLDAAESKTEAVSNLLDEQEAEARENEARLRSEVRKLNSELDQMKAASASSEFPRLGTIRILPDAVTGAESTNPERDSQLESARQAAAEAAARAGDSSGNTDDRADEIRNPDDLKLLEKSGVSSSTESRSELRFQRDDIFEEEDGRPLEQLLIDQDKEIHRLKLLMRDRKQTDGETIATLRSEVDSLRAILQLNTVQEDGQGDRDFEQTFGQGPYNWQPDAASVAIR